MDARAAIAHWMETYPKIWSRRDPKAVVSLFTEDAVYNSHPFRTPYKGSAGVLEYSKKAFAEDELLDLRWGQPLVEGSKGAVEYWAHLRENGVEMTLTGSLMLHFAPDGRIRELREVWSMEEGILEPPPGWGK